MSVNQPFFLIIRINRKCFAGLLPLDKEAEEADTWSAKSHSLEISKHTGCLKIPVVTRIISSNFETRPILGELLYHTNVH